MIQMMIKAGIPAIKAPTSKIGKSHRKNCNIIAVKPAIRAAIIPNMPNVATQRMININKIIDSLLTGLVYSFLTSLEIPRIIPVIREVKSQIKPAPHKAAPKEQVQQVDKPKHAVNLALITEVAAGSAALRV